MQKKICLLTYFNQYESKRYFTDRFREALERLGVQVLIIDPKDGRVSEELTRKIVGFSPDVLFSFNSTVPDKAGRYLWDHLQIPNWTALVDPAFYAIEMTRSPLSRFCTVDREDCQWLLDNGVRQTFFWPHAVEANPPLAIESEPIYDCVFLGTCTDFEGLKFEWNRLLGKRDVEVLTRAIERMFTPPAPSLMKAIVESVSSFPSLNPQACDFKSIFYFLDNFVRGKDRYELIRSIKGAKVHVFGEPSWNNPQAGGGWKDYLGDLPHVVLHPPVSYRESFQVMQRAKVCLNSVPFFHHGSHERIMNALMAGSLPITTQNGFTDEFFVSGEDLVTYQPGKWQDINETLASLMSNEKKRQEMAAAGRAKVRAQHTWDTRAKTFLEAVF